MASAGHSPALPLPSSAHPALGRRALTIARRAVGVLSLATVAACTLHLVAAAASHPILLVPARRGSRGSKLTDTGTTA